ncbi:MAG: hypothetical protein JSW16_00555 [Dehalococcoidales bacterium]|nr:MAG: hypothetical protein JSW16_00555 [Dehalococcoidales bacterium]
MNVPRQLYQLQEIDQELESNEKALREITSQLGDSEAVIRTREQMAREQLELEELGKQQRSVEWEIDDLSGKLTTAEKNLYSGRIRNPKELSNLQQETAALKTRRNRLEEKALEIMDQVETADKNVSRISSDLKALETEWQHQQQQLAANLAEIKGTLSRLKERRQLLADEVDPAVIEIYQQIKKQRGTAVARVEQGICRGCRISLPVTEVQQTRSGNLVRCSSCGRILFLA